MELFLDVLGESLVDTAKMLPFLFLAYLLIEYIETRHGERIEALLAGGGRWGAIPGAVLGCVPQCGFSAIASNFYSSRVITLGTLMAVYLATSDEAIPLLVSMPAYWNKLAVLMVIKVVYAIVVGFVLDFVLRGVLPKSLRGGYTGYVGSARKLFKKLGAIVTEIDISTEAYSTIQSVFEEADVIYLVISSNVGRTIFFSASRLPTSVGSRITGTGP